MNLEHKQMDLFEKDRPRMPVTKYICKLCNIRCARYTTDDLIDRPDKCPLGKTPHWTATRR